MFEMVTPPGFLCSPVLIASLPIASLLWVLSPEAAACAGGAAVLLLAGLFDMPSSDATDAPSGDDAPGDPAGTGGDEARDDSSAPPFPSKALDHISSGLLVLDNAYRIVHFNRTVRDLLPDVTIEREEPLPPRLAERLPAAGGRTFFPWPPESDTILQLEARAVRGDTKTGWVLSLRDVTHLVRTEEALHDTSTLLCAILDTSVTAVAVVNEQGRITYANRRAEDILGLRHRASNTWTYEQLGWTLTPVEDASGDAATRQPLRSVLETGTPIRGMRCAITWPDGTRKFLSLHAAPLSQVESPRQVVFSVEDITERYQTQQRLRREQRFSEAAINSLPGVFYMVDSEGRHRRWNRTFEQVTGYTSDELSERALHDLFHPGDRTLVRESVRGAFPDGNGFSVEATLIAKDGTRMPYVFTGALTRIEDTTYLVGVGLDVTEQKEREHKLRQATREAEAARAEAERMNTLKSAFLANMSHEIRTPLTSIIGFADALVEEDNPPPSFAKHIAQGGRRLLSTLESILELSKLEAGERSIALSTINVTEQLQSTLRSFASDIARKDLTLDVAFPTLPCVARLDAMAVQRIVTHLLSNAVKFTQRGDDVLLHLHREAEHLRILVADTGSGIPADVLPHVCEPFTQASSGLAREHEGSGLGLTLARGLTTLMGGHLVVHTVAGGGTAVVVHLPHCVVGTSSPDAASS
jgi:PAS domain S-box-containing protein